MNEVAERSRTPYVAALLGAVVLAACTALADGPAPDDPSCAVYRAFYAQLAVRTGDFFQPATSSLSGGAAPSVFARDAGEEFSMDTSPYFGQLGAKPSFNIADCFAAGGPQFHDGLFDALEARQTNRDGFIALWSLSPVAVAPDNRYAMMYAEHNCGALCGSGEFYLFEWRGEEWTVIGVANDWIS